MRRRSSRAVVTASCTRALPCPSASWCSMPLAYQAMPPPTSSTIAVWIAISHQPRPLRAGSGSSDLARRAMRANTSAATIAGALDEGLHHERQSGEQGEERGYGEGSHEVVFVVEDLDV